MCECRVVKTKGGQCHPKMSGLRGEMDATEGSVVGYRRLLSEDRSGIRAAQRHVIRGKHLPGYGRGHSSCARDVDAEAGLGWPSGLKAAAGRRPWPAS